MRELHRVPFNEIQGCTITRLLDYSITRLLDKGSAMMNPVARGIAA